MMRQRRGLMATAAMMTMMRGAPPPPPPPPPPSGVAGGSRALSGGWACQLENLQPEVQSLAKQLRREVSAGAARRGWSEREARFHFRKNLKRIVSELYIRDNCHPFKASLLIWIQVPVWVFVSMALRNFSIGRTASEELPIQEQLSVGGTLWFMDLTAPDHTLILPITLGLLNLLIVEVCKK